MTEQSISLERLEDTMSVFGSFDENIRMLEHELGVSVVSRDSQLKITGDDPEGVMHATKVIENLMAMGFNFEDMLSFGVSKEYIRNFLEDLSEEEIKRYCPDEDILQSVLNCD